MVKEKDMNEQAIKDALDESEHVRQDLGRAKDILRRVREGEAGPAIVQEIDELLEGSRDRGDSQNDGT